MKCHCGYETSSLVEENFIDLYGCARPLVTKSELSFSILACSIINGKPIPAREEEQEDPNAFKENFIKKYEKQHNRKGTGDNR